MSGFLIWWCQIFFNFFSSSQVCSLLGETRSSSSLAESRLQSKVCGFVSELGITKRSSTTLSTAFLLCLPSSWKPSIWRTNSTSTACIPEVLAEAIKAALAVDYPVGSMKVLSSMMAAMRSFNLSAMTSTLGTQGELCSFVGRR